MALVSPDGVAPSWMVAVSACVNLPLHHKVQKFSSGTGSSGWSWKKSRKTVMVLWIDGSKSKPMDDKSSLKEACSWSCDPFKFWGPNIFVELLKLESVNFLHRWSMSSVSLLMTNHP